MTPALLTRYHRSAVHEPLTRPHHRTSLHDLHVQLEGRMVPFAGWELPLQFQGILGEARAVRSVSGLFDVSHMGRLWVEGAGALNLLEWLLSAPLSNLSVGRARYTLLCLEDGGILDDGIVYHLEEQEYLLVCNAANREAVLQWLHQWRDRRFPHARVDDRTFQTGMIALQGPASPAQMERLASGVGQEVRPFQFTGASLAGVSALVARTGYTGEDGFECILPAEAAPALWQRLLDLGAISCGLGARDVLRLEAGLLLHGTDMHAATNPFEAGLERFVSLEKEAVFTPALRQVQHQGVERRLTGFQMAGRAIPRHGYTILHRGRSVGQVTSGGYAPSLDTSVGLGYVPPELAAPGATLSVDVRGRAMQAQVVPLPFYSRRRA